MKLISWNVNGMRAAMGKGFMDIFTRLDADIFCLQETKMQQGQADIPLPSTYQEYWNSAMKKGYSGTAVFTRIPPLSVRYGMGLEQHDSEGRMITLEFSDFYLVNVYVPNSQRELTRLSYRMEWEDDFRHYVQQLDEQKPVIICGDMNVAHQEIDLKNYKSNRGNSGFTDEERGKMSQLLDAGFVDSFRLLYPDVTGAYSWWSYLFKARQNNAGWRIDYFLTSQRIKDRIQDSRILSDVMGSDHCPVELLLADA